MPQFLQEAQVIPLPRQRMTRPLTGDEPRGQILLYTGVRYERLVPPVEPPSGASPKLSRTRRR
jgi:hypothetical protein